MSAVMVCVLLCTSGGNCGGSARTPTNFTSTNPQLRDPVFVVCPAEAKTVFPQGSRCAGCLRKPSLITHPQSVHAHTNTRTHANMYMHIYTCRRTHTHIYWTRICPPSPSPARPPPPPHTRNRYMQVVLGGKNGSRSPAGVGGGSEGDPWHARESDAGADPGDTRPADEASTGEACQAAFLSPWAVAMRCSVFCFTPCVMRNACVCFGRRIFGGAGT